MARTVLGSTPDVIVRESEARIAPESDGRSLLAPTTSGTHAATLSSSSNEGGQMEATGSTLSASVSRSLAAFVAVAGVALAAGLAAWGTFSDNDHEQSEYLIVLGIIGVAALVVFGWIVPRALRKESAAVAALTLAIVAVLTVAAFWSGLPPVLAAGAIVVGLAGWDARERAWMCRTAVVIGVFAVVADIAVYLGDMT
jgi:hypothetical protein